MSAEDISMAAEVLPVLTEDEMFHARLAVCAAATSTAEAMMFLDMLGLL